MKKNKKEKFDKKLPFYLKPLEKVVTSTTNSLLVYFYNYSKDKYSETRDYDTWLSDFHDYMKNPL